MQLRSPDELFDRVRREAGLTSTQDAQWMMLAVFAALKEQISPGEAEDVFDQIDSVNVLVS
ncbi:MAG TPA: DUF2267 domain-containing protein [Thermoanaerobaculaceae bacterium]|nr:DUF2267 domain-containing protein [Thermoanaerobaculaceae bacterium]